MDNIRDYKIQVIGDSITKGVIIDNGKITKLNKNAIDLIEEHYQIKINNNSIFGQTLKRIYERNVIDTYLNSINKEDKNLVVLSLGGNDSDFDWKNVSLTPLEFHSSKTDVFLFKQYLEEIIKKLQLNNVKIVITTLFPINSKRYFDNVISKIGDDKNILSFLNNDLSNINRHQEGFNDLIYSIASKYNCEILDIRSNFLMNINYLDYVSLDGIHPNQEGQNLIANIIINYLNNKLKEN